MALAAPDHQHQAAAFMPSLPLRSNNPFRNRANSPSPSNSTTDASSPTFPPPSQSPYRSPSSIHSNHNSMSKNPFLDVSETATAPAQSITNNNPSDATGLFNDLSLLDKPDNAATSNALLQPPPPTTGKGMTSTSAPPAIGTAARTGALPSRLAPAAERTNGASRGPPSPVKREHRRPRGMSESSAQDRHHRSDRERGERPERTESEERRRRERRKEREERHRREKERARKEGRPARKPQGLDIIDKLDVTGIYGQGLFHHDGPFDACNPHRNVKKNHRAPMQAFPEGSANMALGGSGPVRSRLDRDKFHGRGVEGFSEYATTRKADTAIIINPTDRIEQVHGDETFGLGTSTFLEGAPAPKSALPRRQSDDNALQGGGGGGLGGPLQRKRSLVQRFRGMSGSRRLAPGEALRSPDARYLNADVFGTSPPYNGGGKAVSAGGPLRARFNRENEVNPFFETSEDYEDAFEKKGAQIRIAEQEKPSTSYGASRSLAPSSPPKSAYGYGLTRSVTADSGAVRPASNEGEKSSGSGGGFLNRMRSIKGGRRARPERRDT